MIPRRRLRLDPADLADCLRAPFCSRADVDTEIAEFESAFARRVGVRHAIAVASGRDALVLIVDALGLRPGDEIVIPAYTLGELLPLMAGRGLVLVPADIDRSTFNVTTESVRAAISPRTRAILVVHLLGAPSPVEEIALLGLPVIEDCAHALGARIGDRPTGSIGVAALFSLEANKAVSAYGGGVVATRDPELAERIAATVRCRPRREWPAVRKTLQKWIEEILVRSPLYGLAARFLFADRIAGRFEVLYRRAGDRARPAAGFSGTQARIARRRLARLDERESRLAVLWNHLALMLPDGFTAQVRDRHGMPVVYNFVARFAGDIRSLRQRALAAGLDLGIGGEVMDDAARQLGREDCPVAAEVADHAVLIPLHENMDEAALGRMVARLASITGREADQ